LAELCAWLEEEHKLKASLPLMVKTMAKLNLTLKKDAARGRTGSGRCGAQAHGLAGGAAHA
jgi:hypothetical protein